MAPIGAILFIGTAAYQALDVIDAYVKNNGGTCKRSEPKQYEEK